MQHFTMKDKVENVPTDYRGSLRPNSTYASSASSTSSYASSVSSSSSASSSSSSEPAKASSFLHSKVSQQAAESCDTGCPPLYPSHYSSQFNTLRCVGAASQLSASVSPSSSPASSTIDGYVSIPAKYATLSARNYSNRNPPATLMSPVVQNAPVSNPFRHSVISSPAETSAGPRDEGGGVHRIPSPSFVSGGSSYNLTRVTALPDPGMLMEAGMRGVSSFGEVTSSLGPKSSRYASTPHLFVFHNMDDDEEADQPEPDLSAVRQANLAKGATLGHRAAPRQDLTSSLGSRTLPRQPINGQQSKEPIYSTTSDIKKEVMRRQDEAARHITEHYEAPHALTRRASSCSRISQDAFAVTNQVVARIETSFKGYRTQVWVCRTMANLYAEEGTGKDASWVLKFTGVPLLLLDLGETRSRDKRRLQVIMAEKESGFELWKDVIDNLTSYKVQEPHFHTMYLSSDHRRRIGFSFNEGKAAMTFYSQLETLTLDPENISLSAPGKKKSKSREKTPKYKAPKKNDISNPCNFHHVTNVDSTDRTRLYSLQVYSGSHTGPVNTPVVAPEPQRRGPVIAPEPHTVLASRPVAPPAAATAV